MHPSQCIIGCGRTKVIFQSENSRKVKMWESQNEFPTFKCDCIFHKFSWVFPECSLTREQSQTSMASQGCLEATLHTGKLVKTIRLLTFNQCVLVSFLVRLQTWKICPNICENFISVFLLTTVKVSWQDMSVPPEKQEGALVLPGISGKATHL